MVAIISGSNRNGNLTSIFANACYEVLKDMKVESMIYYLSDLPNQLVLDSLYSFEDSVVNEAGLKLIEPSDRLLFVVPEYNGSIPGILKLFIDSIKPSAFKDKKAALIGVATGRAGNLRGLDHLTDILHHLQVNVMPKKLPISKMNELLENGKLVDEDTFDEIKSLLTRFLNY